MTPQEKPQIFRPQTSADIAGGETVCPVCSRETLDEFVPLRVLEDDLQKLISANAPDTVDFRALCARCLKLFNGRKRVIGRSRSKATARTCSTPLRLDADDRYTGKA